MLHYLTTRSGIDVMRNRSPLNEQEQAELVAFLDGELAGDAARKMEARLSQDAAVRAEADALKRAWDLLDFLPQPEPSPTFTHRTLERVIPVRTGARAAARGPSPWWTIALGLGWLLCLALAGVAGFYAYEALVPPPAPPAEPAPPKPPPDPAKPAYLHEFPPEVQSFVKNTLEPMLSPMEKKYLHDAEGQWPQYGHRLIKLASRHPVLPPVRDTVGATSLKMLPQAWKTVLHNRLGRGEMSKEWQSLHQMEGKWPRYALAVNDTVAKVARARLRDLPPLGACRPRDFPPDITLFIEETLYRVLTPAEKKNLAEAEGKWPDYPQLLIELAANHQLVIPGMMLPDF